MRYNDDKDHQSEKCVLSCQIRPLKKEKFSKKNKQNAERK